MRRSSPNRKGRWAVACLISLALHPAVLAVVEVTRQEPQPRLFLDLRGEGSGRVVFADGTECVDGCERFVQKGSVVVLSAAPAEGSVFDGWDGPCGSQQHRVFSWVQSALGQEGIKRLDGSASQLLEEGAKQPLSDSDPLTCAITLSASTHVSIEFGQAPEQVEVDWVVDDALDNEIKLPEPTLEKIEDEKNKREVQKRVVKAKPLELMPVADAAEKKAKAPKPSDYRMKSVEVPSQEEIDKAPLDANYLSDKNRDVLEETRAQETNLERDEQGKELASEKSSIQSDVIGGRDEDIAQLEESKETALDEERDKESVHRGKHSIATGVRSGEDGENGNEGDGATGLLSMRGVQGQGGLESKLKNSGTRPGARGRSGRRGLKTQLNFDDYKRIAGDDKAALERHLSKRKMSTRRGRHEAKMKAFRSSLETFTPEVKTGNQTALKTRADPFARYLNRMHLRIHELWGFGFLVSMGSKFPDRSLWGKMEIIIFEDGTIDAVNIARTSGNALFDAAAFSVLYESGPFEPPPDAIKSGNGKTYLHWKFHRDGRQCGTFGATPFILDNK